MKTARLCAFIALTALLTCCCRQQQACPAGADNETTVREVRAQFDMLAAAINGKDPAAWSAFYSRDGFASAIAGTDCYTARDAWVAEITEHFSMREDQSIEPLDVRITPLAPGLALLTSEEKSEMKLKDGSTLAVRHVFTMIWRREESGWKILHSHESWK